MTTHSLLNDNGWKCCRKAHFRNENAHNVDFCMGKEI